MSGFKLYKDYGKQVLKLKTTALLQVTGGYISFDFGLNSTGDMFFRGSSGPLTRLPLGTTSQVLTVASGSPTWGTNTGNYTPTKEVSFKVGTTGNPADGATSFVVSDGSNTPLTSTKINLFIEEQRKYLGTDFTYDPATATVTLTNALIGGQRVSIEVFPSIYWIEFDMSTVGTGGSSGFPYTFPATF